MNFIDFLRIMFCGCCQPELFMLSSSKSTQSNNLEQRDDLFKNDCDSLIAPGSNQVKYTFAVEDPNDSDVSSDDSCDTYSSAKTNTNTENSNDIMRTSFDSNESWEMMIEDNLDYSENIKYV